VYRTSKNFQTKEGVWPGKNNPIKIGVLGGIGPEATGLFYLKLIKKLQEKKLVKNNKDFPQIIINSIPAKELINEKITNKDLSDYFVGLKELEKNNVDFIVMVCNTIHLFFKNLQKEINVPIINLKEEMRKELEKRNVKKILILGTTNTVEKLYNFNKFEIMKISENEKKELAKSIFLFNKGEKKEQEILKVKTICEKYLNRSVELIVCGCTEFGVMLENDIPKINSIDVLVNATIKKIKEKNNLRM
jgi:aspartate racemase